MTDDFDTPPRTTKRRRISTYQASGSVLKRKENGSFEIPLDEHTFQLNDKERSEPRKTVNRPTPNNFVKDDRETSRLSTTKDKQISAISQPLKSTSLAQTEAITTETSSNESRNKPEENVPQPRSSGRERKKPQRYSISPEQPRTRKSLYASKMAQEDEGSTSEKPKMPETDNTPKSILTPSRKEKRPGPRKSVNFDQNTEEIEKHLGFRDINVSAGRTPSRTKAFALKEKKRNIELQSPVAKSKKTSLQQTTSSGSEVDADLDAGVADIDDEFLPLIRDEVQFVHSNTDEDPVTLAIKSRILARIVRKENTAPSPHLQSQYDALYLLLKATVTSGESNSLLLLGARGTGKSRILDAALFDLSLQYPNDFHVVRLNGFYQTDDKLALRETWRQLGREMQVDEMEIGENVGSYADTMASLLSLLAHSEELSGADAPGYATEVEDGTVRTSKSVIFILDEFDLFTTHPRQTLLYNLFDIAQSKKAPVAVVGCSTRMDVVECLEKRVKSRFSQRWLHVPSAKTLEDFEAIIRSVVCYEIAGRGAEIVASKIPTAVVDQWNDYVQSVFLPSAYVQGLIKHIFYTTKSIPDILSALYIPLALIQLSRSPSEDGLSMALQPKSTVTYPALLALLPSLPTLHLALLIAASRLDTIHDLTNLNFNLVYTHYAELISRAKLQVTASGAVAVGAALRQWSRRTAQSAWEDLGIYQCIVPVSRAGVGAPGLMSNKEGSRGGHGTAGEGANVKLWRVEVTLDDLEWAIKDKWSESGGVRDLLSKWCKEI